MLLTLFWARKSWVAYFTFALVVGILLVSLSALLRCDDSLDLERSAICEEARREELMSGVLACSSVGGAPLLCAVCGRHVVFLLYSELADSFRRDGVLAGRSELTIVVGYH
jgi:hypothetical protein